MGDLAGGPIREALSFRQRPTSFDGLYCGGGRDMEQLGILGNMTNGRVPFCFRRCSPPAVPPVTIPTGCTPNC